MKALASLIVLLVGQIAIAADPAPAADTNKFEVIDVSGQVAGEAQLSADAARDSWTKACAAWKKESIDINKNNGNQVLGINCNSPACNTIDAAKTQCTSIGVYKVKTAGVRVPEPPAAAPLPPDHEITTAPPPVIVEAVPPPRVGFVWLPGFWGWQGMHHVWIPGHWSNERPGYIWVGQRWGRYGHGWHFYDGHWDVRP